jgi:orotate phosphoribosyltransferase
MMPQRSPFTKRLTRTVIIGNPACTMQDYQRQFIEFALDRGVLRFGEFTLKSGRLSPYFFNSGLFNDGDSLYRLGEAYTLAVEEAGLGFDMVFGPAYKGIPLAAAFAIASRLKYGRNVPYCFDRKEEKDHGEGGRTLGAALSGRVLIVDDVITAGTSVNHSVALIRAAGAEPAGVAVALDRQERGEGKLSAIQEVEQKHSLRVVSIVTLENLIEHIESQDGNDERLAGLQRYREKYGAAGGRGEH